MERLTERTSDGEVIPRMDLRNNGHKKCMKHLAEYEDLEERLEKIYGKCDEMLKIIVSYLEKHNGLSKPSYKAILLTDEDAEKWEEWKRLEEQGKLLILPVAAGDRIYRINTFEWDDDEGIEICEIDNIVMSSDGAILFKYDAYDGVICELENIVTEKPYLDYYRVFLTQEQAESALLEMKETEGR